MIEAEGGIPGEKCGSTGSPAADRSRLLKTKMRPLSFEGSDSGKFVLAENTWSSSVMIRSGSGPVYVEYFWKHFGHDREGSSLKEMQSQGTTVL